jgi:hypothetical protein
MKRFYAMGSEKTKIRISSIVLLIIDNDCQAFGFISKDNKPNRNGFLNKLIPNLLEARKERRNKIEHVLHDDFGRKDSEAIYEAVNTVIDQVYFEDEETEKLHSSFWLRPDKSSIKAFDEIEESELKITSQDYSSYIRGLLNEYSRFPMYKRQSLAFNQECEICRKAFETDQIMLFRYKGMRYRVHFYAILYGFLSTDETNYIIALDAKTWEIKSFDLSFVESPILIKEKLKLSDSDTEALQSYVEKCDFSDNHIEKIKKEDDDDEGKKE